MTVDPQEYSKPEKFTARGIPVLSRGNWSSPCGTAENLWIRVKVCAPGEGNPVHSHVNEDHAYFVLGGSGVFIDRDSAPIPVQAFDGIMLRKGTFYGFTNTGDDNLVMLLIFGAQLDESEIGDVAFGMSRRSAPTIEMPPDDGDSAGVGSPFAGSDPGVIIPGRVFDPN